VLGHAEHVELFLVRKILGVIVKGDIIDIPRRGLPHVQLLNHPSIGIRAGDLTRLYVDKWVFFPESVCRGPDGIRVLGAVNYELSFFLGLCHDSVVTGLKDIALCLRLRFCLQQRRTLSRCSRGKNPTCQEKKDYGCAKKFSFRNSPLVFSFAAPFLVSTATAIT
jgi:hypothetical protein